MAIGFPNRSRSYDSKHHSVRFWGHDGAREVSFLVGEDALCRIDRNIPRNEDGFLDAFDENRELICKAASKAYSRRGSGFHTLAATDF